MEHHVGEKQITKEMHKISPSKIDEVMDERGQMLKDGEAMRDGETI